MSDVAVVPGCSSLAYMLDFVGSFDGAEHNRVLNAMREYQTKLVADLKAQKKSSRTAQDTLDALALVPYKHEISG